MRKLGLFLLITLSALCGAAAQSGHVTGSITGPDGGVLPGCVVTVDGGRASAVSDINGNYSIAVNSNGSLTFSLLGMIPQSIRVQGRSVIDVELVVDAQTIAAVSVYGTSISQHAISGSVSSLSAAAVTSTTVTSFDQALAGKMAGVQIGSSSGLLADGISIRIRGTNSISSSSQPLVVVDGVPLTESSNLNVFNGGNGTRFNPMATINQNDIASIEVLKDAAAAALYGSRAGNGVVLITTKRGSLGRTQVSYNNYFSWAKASRRPQMLKADDFITIQNEAASNLHGPGTKIAGYPVVDGKEQRVETDWMDLVFRNAFSQNHSMSVSGGSDKFNFYASADWLKQEGIVRKNDLNRYSFRATVDGSVNKWFKTGVSLNYSRTENKGVLSNSYLAGVTIMSYLAMPNVPEKNPDGSYALNANGLLAQGGNLYSYAGSNTYGNAIYHPTAVLNLQRNANTSDRTGATVYGTITPLKGLSVTSKVSIDNMTNFEDQYSHPLINGLGKGYNGIVQDNTVMMKQWNWQTYANYNATFGDHTVGAMAGVEYQERHYQDIYAGAYKFASSDFQDILDGFFTESQAGGTKNSRGFASMFSNVSYNYKGRYYFEGYLRNDAYSGFGKNKKWGLFPGGSLAWIVSDEGFMESTGDWLSLLKVRTSIGIVGNSQISPYAAEELYAGGQYAYVNGISPSQVGNPDLTWENNRKFNIGFEAGFLNDRFKLSAEYWRSDISNLLLDAEAHGTTGLPGPWNNPVGRVFTNLGKMSNSGIEISINTRNVVPSTAGGLGWNSTLNLTTVKNRVKKLFSEISGTNYLQEGRKMGEWWMPEWAGVDSKTGRPGYINHTVNENTPAKYDGQVKYYDASPGVTDRWKFEDGTVAPALGSSDNVFQGTAGSPTWYGNFDNTLTFRGFDFTVGLQYAGGNRVLNIIRGDLMTTYLGNKSTEILNRWQKEGDKTDVPRLVWGQDTGIRTISTRNLERADYLRLRELTLGYTLPSSIQNKLGFGGRVYVRANNVFIITGYKGSDPELSTYVANTQASNVNVGRDNRSVPAVKTITVGLNLNF